MKDLMTPEFLSKMLQMMEKEAPNTLSRVNRKKVLDSLTRRGITISLTHLLLDKKHPLYKYARRYQLHRIKGLASQQQYRTSF